MFKKAVLLVVSFVTGVLTAFLMLAATVLFFPAVFVTVVALVGFYISVASFDAATGWINLKREVDELKQAYTINTVRNLSTVKGEN